MKVHDMTYFIQSCIIFITLLVYSNSGYSEELSHYQNKTRNVYYQTKDVISQGERFSFSEKVDIQKIKLSFWTSLEEGSFYLRIFGNEGGNNVPLQETDLVEPIEIAVSKSGISDVEIELDSHLEISSPQIFIVIENNTQPIYLVSDSEERAPNCASDFDGNYYNQVIKSNHKKWTVGNLAFDISIIYEVVENQKDSIFTPIDLSSVFNEETNFSISFSDLNRDDYLDIVYNGRVYLNKKNFEFQCIDSTVSKLGNSQANIVLDINNDGLEDIIFLAVKDSNSCKSFLYLQTHGLEFEVSELCLPELERIADFKVCDFDEDQFLDLVITQSSVDKNDSTKVLPNYLFRNSKTNQFEEIPLSHKNATKQSYACKIIDYNQDGKDDIYIVNYNANDEVWIRNKETIPNKMMDYIEVANQNLNSQYIDYCLIDLQNDGTLANLFPIIGLTNQNMQLPYTDNIGSVDYLNDKDKSISYSSIASGDIDNDGKIELFFSTPCECNYSKFYTTNEELNSAIDILSGINKRNLGENSTLIDLNNDGQLDLVSFDNMSLVVFKNNYDKNNYLDLAVYDDEYNNQTKYSYELYSSGKIYYSHPNNQEGLLIQKPNILHFGVGDNTIIDSLLIADKDGNIERVLRDLDVNTKYNLEDFASLDNSNNEVFNITIAPNPFIDRVKISFNVPIWSEVNLHITDINGKLIWKRRVLCQNEGHNQVVWDAYDKNYQRVPNGTYFISITYNSQTEVIKVIKIDN